MYTGTTYNINDGIPGRLMAKTLGYLVLLIVILGLGSVVGIQLGSLGMWVGFVLAILATIMVSRQIESAGAAFLWGILAAVGLGMVVSAPLWYAILYQGSQLMMALISVLLAVLASAAVVAVVPWDFSKIGPLLFLGLIVLIITSLLSAFIPALSGVGSSVGFNLLGVVIFTGYLLVDLSIMRYRGREFPADGLAIVLAVSLLVDIINLLLFILRLGRR
ncbi:Bax inhibitor-1 family protein [Sulfobacillus thermosulfidooxidans]|uniref:Bax inhibitor-1 family protein n=1 Tax=Sulfobacillus thermosulfidooxidans TaxID=28034 RepID=UPI00096BC303|nr:Bax inhibitor-1 family protein [Sulfobacillus thermosulfidooxidans]OLZ11992.1 hypothetical protein BFX05_05835 [Sulfobacillus thermosulfidooxidans]OLZ16757.1 hypothetical protein BFX06_14760 [Sulfobacillus thermosulfidooxidans]OLZ20695.1 hypothetical protein BFX07_14520 [Sulfobacillus thermosulfidooxidans]